MAKEPTKGAEKVKRQPPPRPELPKYNAGTLAQDLGVGPSAVRILLRKSTLEKNGAVWGWDTKADYEAALKQLKALQAPKAEKPAKADKKASKK